MTNRIRLLGYALCYTLYVFSISACSKCLPAVELQTWCKDPANGLVKKKTLNGVEVQTSFIPAELMLARKISSGDSLPDDEALKKLKDDYSSHYYFQINIRPDAAHSILQHNIQNENEYHFRTEYFNFLSEADLCLVSGIDTFPCVLTHFENSFELSPESRWNIVFKIPPGAEEKDQLLIWNDQATGMGKLKFIFKKEDLLNIPLLQVES